MEKEKSQPPSSLTEDHVPLAGSEKLVAQLAAALAKEDVDTRSSLGQTFTKYLKDNPEKAAEYKALRCPGQTVELKRQFRLRWAEETRAQNCKKVKVKREEWKQIDREMGTYEPLERIIWLEGGKEYASSVQAALIYVRKAVAMGGDWIRWNPMTERSDVLYLKKGFETEFLRSWAQYSEFTQDHADVLLLSR